VKSVTRPAGAVAFSPGGTSVDEESRAWLRDLRASGSVRDAAVARLHALLLRAARFEVARRRPTLPHLRGNELDDIALEAADDALMSVLARLDDFRGASRFTTWVYKFALLEAAVKLRKRAWQGREVPLEPETWACSRAPASGRAPRRSSLSCLRPSSEGSARR
jgi:RNA polymerase sigma-70 factor (ECF subfamily)